MSFPFFQQPDSMDCGPTCLQMIAKHFGKTIPLQELREKTQIGKEGVSLLGISEAAEQIGFRTKAVQLNYSTLVQEAPLPAILHWNQYHFVVLYKVKKNKLYIADPAHGLVIFTRKEFHQRWISHVEGNGDEEGIALLIEPTPALNDFIDNDAAITETGNKQKDWAFRKIFNYLIPYKKLIAQLFIGLGVASLIQLLLPFLTQSIVDIGINSSNINFVYLVLIAQFSLFISRLATDVIRSRILFHISSRINISILTDFLIKLLKLPVSHFESKKTGDILQRMNDHHRIDNFLTGSSINVLFSFANLIVFSIVLFFFNSKIFLLFIFSSILYAAWVTIFLKRRKLLDYKRFDIASREQSATIQIVQGIQEIKLNGIEKQTRWKWEQLQAKLFRLNMKGFSLDQWQQSGALFINESKNILITFLSAKSVIDGELTLGSMVAMQYIIGQLNSPVEQMIGFLQNWQNAKISMDRLNEIHRMDDEEPAHKFLLKELPVSFKQKLTGGADKEPYTDLPSEHPTLNSFETATAGYIPAFNSTSEEAIRISHLNFTYPGAGNEPILKDINLSIPLGKTTAIVGMSGSGKTTLLKLLLRFYDPQKGEIKINNISLSALSHGLWRSHCGVVMQESFIFSDTIARNIAVGVEKVDVIRLEHAAEAANLREFIENLPLGYNTKIGTEGTGISMGQKQRILIARAVYRDPAFILFDEATNSLDANNETVIMKNLNKFFLGKTVIVVAHRLSTVKHADQIIVLNKGRIAETGKHNELVALRGEYYMLVKNQLELGD